MKGGNFNCLRLPHGGFMGKNNIFYCKECGYESAKWLGQCPGCREWNTFVEEAVMKKGSSHKSISTGELKPSKLSEISLESEERTKTELDELDRVLGGGIVSGSLVLVGGDPGIGKSTLLLQVCKNLSEKGKNVLYVSGEESLKQIKIRANRIGNMGDSLSLLCETNLDIIEEIIRKYKPEIVVIDSIQTMFKPDISSAPGSVSQVREITSKIMRMCKYRGCKEIRPKNSYRGRVSNEVRRSGKRTEGMETWSSFPE